jgi:hypothetical protein
VRLFGLVDQPAPTVALEDVLARTPGRLDTVVDGQLLVFHPDTGDAHLLNASAALILLTVDGRRTVGDVVDELHAETGVDRHVLERDVTDTLGTFVHGGLVSWFVRDEPAGADPGSDGELVDYWDDVVARRLAEVDWPITLGPYRAGTAAVTVRTDAPELAELLSDACAALVPAGDDTDLRPAELTVDRRALREQVRYRVHADGRRVGWVDEPTRAVGYATAAMNQLAADVAGGRVLLHGGAVERDGVVVAITGPGGRGKTTLTAALVEDGFAYVTDELVVVDPATLTVQPYPKPFDLDTDAIERLAIPLDAVLGSPAVLRPDREHQVRPGALGSVSSGGRLGLVVLLGEPADVGASPERLAPGPAVLRLLIDVLPTTWEDPTALDTLSAWCEQLPVLALPRMDLAAAVATVREVLHQQV